MEELCGNPDPPFHSQTTLSTLLNTSGPQLPRLYHGKGHRHRPPTSKGK